MRKTKGVLYIIILLMLPLWYAPSAWPIGGGGITGGGGSIKNLSDTVITTPSDNQALIYDAATGKWKNADVSSAAGGDMAESTWDADSNGAINVQKGGTNKTSWTLYSIPWASSTTVIGEIAIGTNGQCLKVNGTATGYEWGACTSTSGDMLQSVYDTNSDNVVDSAAAVAWGGVSSTPTTLGGYGITDAQGIDADLTTLAALGNWKIPYTNGSSAIQTDLGTGTANYVLISQGATAVPTWGLIGSANITDNSVAMGDIASTLTGVNDTTIWNLSPITQSEGVDEGFALPVWANVSPATTSGVHWMTWDATGHQFKVYDGGWVTIGGGGAGAPTDAQYLTMALDGTLSAERAVTATLPVRFTAASSTSAVVSIDNASATARGVVELATNAEAQAGTADGSSGPLAVTPANLVAFTGSANIATLGTVTTGTWTGTSISAAKGGTAIDTSASTGVPSISSGTWSVASTLANTLGGTGQNTSAWTGFPQVSSGTWSVDNAAAHRTAAGLAIGTNVQAWDADLDDLADGSLTVSKVATPGADTQVIYNDGGSWAGSSDFTFNKTTKVLTVTGGLTIPQDNTTSGELRLRELQSNGSDYVGFKAPDNIASSLVWTVPSADGSSNQILYTNGAGVLGWKADSTGGTPTFDAVGSGTNTTATMTVGTGGVITVSGSGAVTSTKHIGTGSTTDAVDLATGEVAGILGAANGGTGNGFTAFSGPASSTKTFTLPNANATITYTVASGTSALGTGAISSATCATVVTTSATGTATTDVIDWGFNGDPTAVTGYVPLTTGMLTIISYPTADNVNFKVCNNTSSSITPGAITLNWKVTR